MTTDDDEHWMRRALALADRAAALDEVPVGALVVRDGELLGEGWNPRLRALPKRWISVTAPVAPSLICSPVLWIRWVEIGEELTELKNQGRK